MRVTTQLVILIGIIVTGMTGLILGLAVWADWSDGAILGMISGFGTVAAGLIISARNQQKTEAQLDDQAAHLQAQGEQLETVVRQTNGMTERDKQEIADRAAVNVIQAWKRGEI